MRSTQNKYSINWPGPASTCMTRQQQQANDTWLGPELCYGPIMAAMDDKISESEPCHCYQLQFCITAMSRYHPTDREETVKP